MSDESRIDGRFFYEFARDSETTELVAHLKSADNPRISARAAGILGDFTECRGR